jgi:hypothetical protein
MAQTLIPTDVGFAEFVSLLISETLESVLSAQISQEQQRQVLLDAATLGLDRFAASYVTEEDIDLLLIQLMPDDEGSTTVVVGGEIPTTIVLDELGISLHDRDVSDGTLTQLGVDRICDGARRTVGDRQQAALRESARRGIPRVVVDEGRIVVKLTFASFIVTDDESEDNQALTDTKATSRVATSGRAAKIDPTGVPTTTIPGVTVAARSVSTRYLAQAIPDALKDIRLVVKPATAEDQATNRTNVYGEVELHFRTIF